LLNIDYKGQTLPTVYRVDFVCYQAVIVELKALPRLSSREDSQALHYLKASRLERAMLLNFGGPSLEYRRFVLSHTVANEG
jgi:GxxExxY protein